MGGKVINKAPTSAALVASLEGERGCRCLDWLVGVEGCGDLGVIPRSPLRLVLLPAGLGLVSSLSPSSSSAPAELSTVIGEIVTTERRL
jgi:hypothetical protein